MSVHVLAFTNCHKSFQSFSSLSKSFFTSLGILRHDEDKTILAPVFIRIYHRFSIHFWFVFGSRNSFHSIMTSWYKSLSHHFIFCHPKGIITQSISRKIIFMVFLLKGYILVLVKPKNHFSEGFGYEVFIHWREVMIRFLKPFYGYNLFALCWIREYCHLMVIILHKPYYKLIVLILWHRG